MEDPSQPDQASISPMAEDRSSHGINWFGVWGLVALLDAMMAGIWAYWIVTAGSQAFEDGGFALLGLATIVVFLCISGRMTKQMFSDGSVIDRRNYIDMSRAQWFKGGGHPEPMMATDEPLSSGPTASIFVKRSSPVSAVWLNVCSGLQAVPLLPRPQGKDEPVHMLVRFLRAASPVLSLPVSTILLTIMLGATFVPQAAIGQDKLPRGLSSYVFQDDLPSKLATAAFEQPYGRAIAAEFAAALVEAAAPECLKAKRIAKDQFPNRAKAILVARGTYLLEHVNSMTDPKVFERYLRARIGNDGVAEVDILRKDPLVRAYLTVDEPARFAYIASYIIENVSRFATLSRITFARPFDPIASEIPAIEKLDPTDKIDADLRELVAADKSGKLSRYLELVFIAQKPYRDAINMDIAKKFGPRELLARPGKDSGDFQDELAKLCAARPVEN